MEKILSLIIPTYNMEKYLNKCLDSLIVDNMNLLEVLIINDGSKDRSSEIAHEYESNYPNTFRVIDKENGNYGSCINRGLKEATGKYIKVLDADDSFDNNNLSSYLTFISQQDNDLILNNCIKVDLEGNIVGTFSISNIYKTISFKEFAQKKIFPQMHCITYKREKIYSISYKQTEGIPYTDQEWVTIPMQNINTVINSNILLYKYLIGREGQTIDKEIWSKSFKHQKKVALSIIKCAHDYKGDQNHKKYLVQKASNYLTFLYTEHIINSVYDELEFKEFDDVIKNNYPFIYNSNYNNRFINLIIKRWRLNKSNKFNIRLFLWINKYYSML